MDKLTTPQKGSNKNITPTESVANHKKIAAHFQDASKSHLEAAKHHEQGNPEKAEKSIITAKDHVTKAEAATKQASKIK